MIRAALLCALLALAPAAMAALAPGDYEFPVMLGEFKRSYLLHVPQQAAAGKPLPVVLNFHGGGGNARIQKSYSRMDKAADRDGYVAVYPNGTSGIGDRLLTWNAGKCCGPAERYKVDDVGFVLVVLEDLARHMAYDRARVYATGLSNGAMMAYRLAVEVPDRFAAVAGVAGAMTLSDFSPTLPVPVMHIHSEDDSLALYGGGMGIAFPMTNAHHSVDSMIGKWVIHNRCPAEPRITATLKGNPGAVDAAHTATRYFYGPCRGGAEVVLWRLTGAGHVWPGGQIDYLPWLLGAGTAVIDANREMWNFFSRFRRR